MKINYASGCAYEDNEGEVTILTVHLDQGEIIHRNEMISIEMMDDSFLEREVLIIDPKYAGDFYLVSKKMEAEVKARKTKYSDKLNEYVEGECDCTIVVKNVPIHEVKTDDEINSRKLRAECERRFNLTPYSQLVCGKEDIHKHTKEGYKAPEKVLAYLRVGEPYLMCPGIYEHPFKEGKRLLGPYIYSDGYYYWDRDTWKYVVKYGLTLPQEFIDHVMSEEGTAFLEKHCTDNKWKDVISKWKNDPNQLCLLPDNAGDIDLEDF